MNLSKKGSRKFGARRTGVRKELGDSVNKVVGLLGRVMKELGGMVLDGARMYGARRNLEAWS